MTEFNIDDIYFFEYIKKRYVKICSKSGDYHFNEKIANIDIDMASYNFFMPHQSFVVNLKYVKDIKLRIINDQWDKDSFVSKTCRTIQKCSKQLFRKMLIL